MVILLGMPKGRWPLPWIWLTVKSKCLEFGMFASPTLSWTWLPAKFKCLGSGMYVRHTLPCTWLTIKSKCLRSSMFVRLILPWSWQTVRSKCFRSGIFVRSTLHWTWLTTKSKCLGSSICFSNPHYLIPLGVPREDGHSFGRSNGECAFSRACQEFGLLPNLACPGLGTLLNPKAFRLWLPPDPAYWGLAHYQAPTRNMLIPLGVPKRGGS